MTLRVQSQRMATTGNGENIKYERNGATLTGQTNETAADRAFDVLADAGRRAVIAELSEGGSLTVDALASRLASRHESESRAKLALVHRHLPKLREADVVSYDPATGTVEFDDAGDVLAVLGVISDRIDR